jgi:hypothetical protein
MTNVMGRVLPFLLLWACASATPPRVTTPGSLGARVDSVDPPEGDRRFVVAVVQLTNPSEHPITVDRYIVDWEGGSARSERDRFVVPPGATVWRRLETRAYDPTAVAAGHVTVETDTAFIASVLR